MVKKKNKDSTKENITPKMAACIQWIGSITLHQLRQRKDLVNTLIQEMRDFGYDPRAKDCEQFFLEKRVYSEKIHEWCRAIPELAQAYKEMKDAIHIRRRMLWGDRQLLDSNFLRYAHNYRKEEQDFNDYHDSRKKDDAVNQAAAWQTVLQSVIGQAYPSSDKVPPAKE